MFQIRRSDGGSVGVAAGLRRGRVAARGDGVVMGLGAEKIKPIWVSCEEPDAVTLGDGDSDCRGAGFDFSQRLANVVGADLSSLSAISDEFRAKT